MDVPNPYATKSIPKFYHCGTCKATGCKLWRMSATFQIILRCADCAAKEGDKYIGDLDTDGKRTTPDGRTDQIGSYVPAVPVEEGMGFWGYTSVPDEGVNWWRNLPTFPVAVAA